MSVLMPILLPLFLDPVAFSFFSRHRDPALAMRRKHKVFVALLRHVQRNARLKWMFSSEGKHGLSSNTNSAVQLGGWIRLVLAASYPILESPLYESLPPRQLSNKTTIAP